jgi:hypothetical protein
MTEINKMVKESWDESKENYKMKNVRCLMRLRIKKDILE